MPNSLDAIEKALKGLPEQATLADPSFAEQQIQQEGNDPEAIAKEKTRIHALQNDRFEKETDHWQTIYSLRSRYIPNLFSMILCWLIVVGIFVFLTGYSAENINNPDCQINCTRFKLSESVLIAFITTTTATVLGLFVIVANWLFPKDK